MILTLVTKMLHSPVTKWICKIFFILLGWEKIINQFTKYIIALTCAITHFNSRLALKKINCT